MQKVAFVLDSRNLSTLDLRHVSEGNPGIGGTEYVTVTTFLALSKQSGDFMLVTNAELLLPSGVEAMITSTDGAEYLVNLAISNSSVAIVSGADLMRCSRSFLERNAAKIVAWIHHPYYLPPKFIGISFHRVVSIGTWQHISNYFLYPKNHILIRNYFQPRTKTTSSVRNPSRLVYLGALVPEKGFHLVLLGLRNFLKKRNELVLRVIGANSTYGQVNTHPHLPTTLAYGRTIEKILDPDLMGRVQFLGNLGLEKTTVLQGASYVLLNPTAKSEAYPASVLEAINEGAPPIAPFKGGYRDVMRSLPELQLKSPIMLGTHLKRLEARFDYRSFRVDADKILREVLMGNLETLEKWKLLAKGVHVESPHYSVRNAMAEISLIRVARVRLLAWIRSLGFRLRIISKDE